MANSEWLEFKREWKRTFWTMATVLAVLWGIFLADNLLFGGSLRGNGIHPREAGGLPGILFAPFLHADLSHIVNNTVGVLTLGVLVLFRGIRKFLIVSAISMVTAGIGVWLVGAPASNHIGYSGVIFGYFGYLLFSGLFDRKIGSILLSVAAAVLYGGMIFGILPLKAGVSWEGHLFGLAGGILCAFLLSRTKQKAS